MTNTFHCIGEVCIPCGKPANFGFGGSWACAEHRQQIEAQWVADGMRKSAEGER